MGLLARLLRKDRARTMPAAVQKHVCTFCGTAFDTEADYIAHHCPGRNWLTPGDSNFPRRYA